jgi:hypothetical protein
MPVIAKACLETPGKLVPSQSPINMKIVYDIIRIIKGHKSEVQDRRIE